MNSATIRAILKYFDIELTAFMSQPSPVAAQSLQDVDPESSLIGLESILKASADQLRLGILQVLKNDAFGVLELCGLFDIKQSAMSHHLKVLSNAGLVRSRREGNSLFYRRALARGQDNGELLTALYDEIDRSELPVELIDAMESLRHQRSEQSLQFFLDNTERFHEQQELISNIEDYREAINELIDSVAPSHQRALELGPGQGHYLPELSKRFGSVFAVDNAKTMLDASEATCAESSLGNIELFHGNTRDFLSSAHGELQFDCVVANMVLHHVGKPSEVIRDIAKLVNKGGLLIITELCHHEQDWVRDAAGDAWLGFDDSQLDAWSESAGFTRAQSSFTALKNGFRIQVLGYLKTN